jgi:hypothetical protein
LKSEMKNKIKNIILFLIILSLIFPLKESKAGVVEWLKGKVEAIGNFLRGLVNCTSNPFLCALSYFTYAITQAFHWILAWFNNNILAFLIGKAATLNPFYNENPKSPVVVIWNILKSFAYIILVFSALAAAYEWLFGNDASAKRLIFNIIVVALIISFTYVLVRETFFVVRSLEEGITNNQLNQLGTLIAASLWQKDPFETIRNITNQIETEASSRYLIQAVFYIFIVVFDMITFIILTMILLLLIVRYIAMILLAGTSSIAAASLTFPEFKGIPALGEIMSQFRFATAWFEYFVRWLLVVPIFVILVILGNVLKENTLAQIGTPEFIEFVILLFLLGSWYIISIRIAVKLSGAVGVFAKGLATSLLAIPGLLAARAVLNLGQGAVGRILTRIGESIQNKVGVGGRFGWKSWVGQKIGARTREIGEKMLERRYGFETEAVKGAIGRIDEQLRRTTDPTQIQNLTSQITKLFQQYKGNDYVLKSINESIKKISPDSAVKILASSENLKAFASSDVPQETKETIIGLVDKLRKGDLRKMVGDAAWLSALKEISPDVADAFVDKIGKEFKETDGLEIISKDEIREIIPRLPENLRKTLNSITKGFVNALLDKNIENISNAMASWDKDIWVPENTEKINNILRSQLSEDEIKASVLETIRKTENRGAIIRGALKEGEGGPLNTILRRMTDQEIEGIKGLLTPQDQAALNSILSRRIIIASR